MRRYLRRGAEVDAVLAEISAINAELRCQVTATSVWMPRVRARIAAGISAASWKSSSYGPTLGLGQLPEDPRRGGCTCSQRLRFRWVSVGRR